MKINLVVVRRSFLATAVACVALAVSAHADDPAQVVITSPNGRNTLTVQADADAEKPLHYAVSRDGQSVIGSSPVGPVLVRHGALGKGARIVAIDHGARDESFEFLWGKSKEVEDKCATARVVLDSPSGVRWELDLRAYDDGVAFRYRVPEQADLAEVEIQDEATQFRVAAEATALYSGYDNFTSSHEELYYQRPIAEIPSQKLLEMPLLLTWPGGAAAAITEGRLLQFAGMYLQHVAGAEDTLQARLSPLPERPDVCVSARAPLASPWRVVLLGDRAGDLLESNLLLCLNDPPPAELGDFHWAAPGKTSFHWWNGTFEKMYKDPRPGAELARHKQYIDFCAKHGIAYHAVTGDGRPWYVQKKHGYHPPHADADILTPRPDLQLPEIIEYARGKGVGIRLWVDWSSLQGEMLEQAFARYQDWGVTGLMVDFLNRDDQEMIEFTEQILRSAARHHLHIQIHGSSKNSGEQRTYPNLFNREGTLNLEVLKWNDKCTPPHNVNIAYARALAGPVDYHLGGFRSVSRAEFKPQQAQPYVLGTRCHHLALYVVYENPMPMVSDEPSAYEGQPGFDFLADVPTTWDETRFLAGEPGEYVVLARRKGDAWYLGGITDWSPREIAVPLDCLGPGQFTAKIYADGSSDESRPNDVKITEQHVSSSGPLHVSLAPGGGFVAVIRPQ